MYIVFHSKKFKKALQKIERSGRFPIEEIRNIILKIATGEKLEEKYQDHKLKGGMSEQRECHIKNDLLLVYELNKKELILLTIDINTHSGLFK
ncbi:MAG: type II toxin-antitoxin system YafQ family toxin [Candidatus Pacebacteria bacterium]|nr:type II toxin-antitoxin system YafQ family toxin [Candidatus Paceibacterota bacterium]